MTTYLIRRTISGFIVLVLASFLIYSILTLAPGGPLDQIKFATAGTGRVILSEEEIERLKAAWKLDTPYPLNYFKWLFSTDERDLTTLRGYEIVPRGIDVQIGDFRLRGTGVLTGDLGDSLVVQRGMGVVEVMGARLGNTLILMSSSLLLALLIAFPIGIISAIRQYSKLDYAVTTFSFFGLSMPTFWLGLMLIIFLAVLPRQWREMNGWTWLPYLPTGGITDVGRENDIINRIYHLVLPVTVLAFVNIAGWSRYIRSSMLEVLRQDYVRTAWAKGLSMRAVILKHALRNALIPLITILALALPGLVSGAIITETVFAYAGMGQLYFEAVSRADTPLAMGFLMITTSLVILANMLADIMYAVVDPRIRYS
jgi:peptide/nickel transport system permease protein